MTAEIIVWPTSFVFYAEWAEEILGIENPTKRQAVSDALFKFFLNGEKPTDSDMLDYMQHFFLRAEKDKNKYDQIIKKRSEAGRKGAVAKYGK